MYVNEEEMKTQKVQLGIILVILHVRKIEVERN